MEKTKLPKAIELSRINGLGFQVTPNAFKQWTPSLRMAQAEENSISILEQIGRDPWTGEGVTASGVASILKSMGNKDVTVYINSPGGDMFEGVSIYNALRAHAGDVTVKVLGIAASAASIIAMAGDRLLMGDGAFLMIHNCLAGVMGNRHVFLDAAAMLEPFDHSMADIYSARSGISKKTIIQMMDTETFINAHDSIRQGFADGYITGDIDNTPVSSGTKSVLMSLVSEMAGADKLREQRKKMFAELK